MKILLMFFLINHYFKHEEMGELFVKLGDCSDLCGLRFQVCFFSSFSYQRDKSLDFNFLWQGPV
jgi:hypothetical protein